MRIFENIFIILKRYKSEMKTKSIILILFWLIIFCLTEGAKILIPSILINNLYLGKSFYSFLIPVFSISLLVLFNSIISFKANRSFMQYRLKEVGNLNARCLLMPIHLSDSKIGQESVESAQRAVAYGNDVGLEAYLKGIFNFMAIIISLFIYIAFSIELPLWIILLMFLTPLIKIPLENKRIKYENKYFEDMIPHWDEDGRLKRSCLDESFGKEARIYELYKIIERKIEKINKKTVKFNKDIILKKLNTDFIFRLIMIVRDIIIIYAFISIKSFNITPAKFVLYLGILLNLSSLIESAYDNYTSIKSNNIHVNRFINFFNSKKYYEYNGKKQVPKSPYTLEFKNVCFSYDDENYILKDLNFTIKTGEKIGIVGRNGAGKTTLVKLICGFYKPNKGEILLNGININDLDINEYYEILSVIFQKPSIFAMSIAQNITLNKNINMNKLNKVIKDSELDEVIKEFKYKENTQLTHYLSDEGVLLSGGETQKLMLARALYKQSDILILDEPTASLDAISESKLYEKYNSLTNSKISFFISHRLISTLFCDKIILLENGTITQSGTHEELILQEGLYKKMFNVQAKKYEKEVDNYEV